LGEEIYSPGREGFLIRVNKYLFKKHAGDCLLFDFKTISVIFAVIIKTKT